jgi:hypothetical protein
VTGRNLPKTGAAPRWWATLALVSALRHIDALLGTCWQWDDEEEDAPGARNEIDALVDEWIVEIDP